MSTCSVVAHAEFALSFVLACDTFAQTPTSIAEWAPGVIARSELVLRATGGNPEPSDIDQDGDVDFITRGASNSAQITILRNDGRGHLSEEPVRETPSMSLVANGFPAVGDIDGDGFADVVLAGMWFGSVAGGADAPYVYLNDRTGHFRRDMTRFPLSRKMRGSPALGDIDRDGDLDVVICGDVGFGPAGNLEIWINDGRGYFTDESAARLPAGTVAAAGIAIDDLDDDGFVDIVVGQGNSGTIPKRIFWNDGTGRFSVQVIPPNASTLQSFIADFDGDGRKDLFFKGFAGRLYLNQGGRQFLEMPAIYDATWGEGYAAVADINGDQLPDVLVGANAGPVLLLNQGRGRFATVPGLIQNAWQGAIGYGTFADVDGDGDQDCLVHGSGLGIPVSTSAVLFNQQRQVWGLPSVPRGGSYRVEVRGWPNTIFAVALGAQRLITPLPLGPLGTWHLDPVSTVSLGGVVTDFAGKRDLTLPIPTTPWLAGRTFYLQGFDLGTTGAPRHTTSWWPLRIE